MSAGRPQPAKANRWGILLVVVLIAGGLALSAWDEGMFDRDDGGPVVGGGLFGADGASRLVTRLDAAAKAQGVCYGWRIETGYPLLAPYPPAPPGARPAPQGTDLGSNLGAGTDPRDQPGRCPRWAVFTAAYDYSSADEEWTSVVRGVQTNLPVSLGGSDLDAIGITTPDLLGDRAAARLADAIGSLPLLLAGKGAAGPVPAAGEAAAPVPAGAEPSPRGNGRFIWMGVAGVLIAGGLAWIAVAAVRDRRA